MRFLLDTHILLSLIERQLAGLPMWVQAFLTDPHSEYHLSAASPWEIAIKSRLGSSA
jgi:PIN domain nuclease of toxin-antitoxin system